MRRAEVPVTHGSPSRYSSRGWTSGVCVGAFPRATRKGATRGFRSSEGQSRWFLGKTRKNTPNSGIFLGDTPGTGNQCTAHPHRGGWAPGVHLSRHAKSKGGKGKSRVSRFPLPGYRWCNARAESQWIVRLADSHTYNTPLLNKVVYNLSISPDTRVVIQRGPHGSSTAGRPHSSMVQGTWPILTRVTSRKGGYRRYSAWILT